MRPPQPHPSNPWPHHLLPLRSPSSLSLEHPTPSVFCPACSHLIWQAPDTTGLEEVNCCKSKQLHQGVSISECQDQLPTSGAQHQMKTQDSLFTKQSGFQW